MTPPRSTTRGTRGTRGSIPPSAPPVDLRTKLVELFTVLEMPFAVMGDAHCSELIQARAPLLAAALEDAAKENPVLRLWLERAVTGGSLLTVVVCALSIVVPVAQHHSVLPGDDPFAYFLPTSPADAARRQATADQMKAYADEWAAQQEAAHTATANGTPTPAPGPTDGDGDPD